MQKKVINGFELNPIGIGTWMMGGGIHRDENIIFASYDNDEKEIKAIKYSISRGQNHIDTAQLYGAWHTDELVGKAIKDFDRSKLFIADKVWKSHMQQNSVIPAVKEMLRKLKTDYLDLLYIHTPSVPEPMEEYISGINDAVDKGLAKAIAVSNFNVEQLKKAMDISKHPIVANQLHYNVLMKDWVTKGMLDFCRENNIMIVAYRPIERRLLADECDNKVVLKIAKKYKKTPVQIALNWLIMQDNVVAIPKAVDKKHIDENLGALEFELKEEDMKLLDSIPTEIE